MSDQNTGNIFDPSNPGAFTYDLSKSTNADGSAELNPSTTQTSSGPGVPSGSTASGTGTRVIPNSSRNTYNTGTGSASTHDLRSSPAGSGFRGGFESASESTLGSDGGSSSPVSYEMGKPLSDSSKRFSSSQSGSGSKSSLPDKEEVKGLTEAFKDLAGNIVKVGKAFAETEQGQELLAGLSDETKVYAESALGFADSITKGFSSGGPAGAAIAGLGELINQTAGAYIESQKRIEASNRELADATAEHEARMEAKQRKKNAGGAQSGAKGEAERDDGLVSHANQLAEKRKAEADAAEAKANLQDETDLANGKDPNEIARRRAERRKQAAAKELDDEISDLKYNYETKKSKADQLSAGMEAVKKTGVGTNSEQYKSLESEYKGADADQIQAFGKWQRQMDLRDAKLSKSNAEADLAAVRERTSLTRQSGGSSGAGSDRNTGKRGADSDHSPDALKEISAKLKVGSNGQELNQIKGQLEAAMKGMSAAITSNLKEMIQIMTQMQSEQRNLSGQIKQLKSGK